MKFKKVINEPIAEEKDGVSVAGGVNAVIAGSINEPNNSSHVSSKQKVRVVQRGGKTEVFEEESSSETS
jgi:hypothetical protein